MCSMFFFLKQKTAYEMRIRDWSSDVCSSDLHGQRRGGQHAAHNASAYRILAGRACPRGNGQRDHTQNEGERCHQNGAETQACSFDGGLDDEIGSASGRERVCQYVSIDWVAVSIKKKKQIRNRVHIKKH